MIDNDIICAISTPGGTGGIAVIRVSGERAVAIVNSLWKGTDLMSAKSHTAHLGELYDPVDGEIIDQCVVTLYLAPRSYTGENVVEIAVHGSRWIQRETIALLQRNGCRMANPGEYTRRAVMNGRMDLSQAEGVADVIASSSRAAHKIAVSQMKGSISRRLAELRKQLIQLSVLLELELDFSEEDVEFADRSSLISTAESIRDELLRLYRTFSKGNAIKEGIPVAIVGATNAGKSSLLNALLEDDRAIVSEVHGTTRDTIEETLEIGDYLFRFIDTAGLRDTFDPVEQIGIERSRKAMSKARIIIVVIDISDSAAISSIKNGKLSRLMPLELNVINDNSEKPKIITVLNKIDIASDIRDELLTGGIAMSAKNGQGLARLRDAILELAQQDNNQDGENTDIMITNLRQAEALRHALDSITPLIDGLRTNLETDLVAQHLRETISHLSSITGEIPSTEILNTIFSSFCVGK